MFNKYNKIYVTKLNVLKRCILIISLNINKSTLKLNNFKKVAGSTHQKTEMAMHEKVA